MRGFFIFRREMCVEWGLGATTFTFIITLSTVPAAACRLIVYRLFQIPAILAVVGVETHHLELMAGESGVLNLNC